MTATVSEPIHLGSSSAAWNVAAIHEHTLRSAHARLDEDLAVAFSRRLWTTLVDGLMLLAVVWTIPAAVLIVGTPVVLVVAFLLWLVRLAAPGS